VLVRILTLFAPDEASTLSKVDKDAAAAAKLVVEGVGHSIAGTAVVGRGRATLSKVDEDAAAAAKLVVEDVEHSIVGTAVVGRGRVTLSKVDEDAAAAAKLVVIGRGRVTLSKVDEDAAAAAKLVVEAKDVGHSIVGTAVVGRGTSREGGIGATGLDTDVETEGGVIREGVVDANSGEFTTTTGIVEWVIGG
jgi:hypothetical protein